MLNDNLVLFLVDHKHRDLPSAVLIGHFLSKKGYSVKYVAYWQEDEIIKEHSPKYIVLGKPIYNYTKLAKWRKEGRKWIALDVEGNPQDLIYEMKVAVFPNMAIYWNNKEYSAYAKYYENNKSIFNKSPILNRLGCPRIDFHHPKWSFLFEDKEQILQRYNLPLENKTITIATSTQDSHFSKEKRILQSKRRNHALSKSADYDLIVTNMEKLRDKTEAIVKIISRTYKNFNLIIKPHPNENVLFWENLIKNIGINNARIMKGEVINNLLAISDLHIAHNVCTTTFEAMLHQIPTIEIHTNLSKDLYEQEHLNLCLFQIEKPEKITEIINQIFETNSFKQQLSLEKVTTYCNKYFGTFDGKRCAEYGDLIDQFIQNDKNKKTSVHFVIINYFIYLKYFIVNRLRSLKGYLWEKIFNYDIPVSEDTKISSDVDVRGRFDNRIKPGDEEYWLKIYEKYDYKLK